MFYCVVFDQMCVVVTITCKVIFFFREFPNHDKRQKQSQSHNLPYMLSLAHCTKSRKFKEYNVLKCCKMVSRCTLKVLMRPGL